jgi:small-conductance mechanosensitive channel
VVEAPAPVALVVGLGANAIDLELRAWTDRFEQWATIRSELAVGVDKAFAEAGIGPPGAARDAAGSVQPKKGGGGEGS